MPVNMSHDEKDPLFVMNSLSDRPQDWYLHSTEDLEDHHSTTSSTESNSHLGSRKDHEFIPTRMKTISASKPAADPSQFTRVNSNPLLISAQKQLMKVLSSDPTDSIRPHLLYLYLVSCDCLTRLCATATLGTFDTFFVALFKSRFH